MSMTSGTESALAQPARLLLWALLSLLVGVSFGALIAILPSTMLAVPVGIVMALVVLVFWAMPQPRSIGTKAAWVALAISLVSFVLWPSYVSIQIPGFPWMSLTRLCLLATLLIWLYCILNSDELRANVADAYRGEKLIFIFLGLYMLSLVCSLAFSRDIADSLNKFSLYQIYYTFSFFAFASLVTTPKRATVVAAILVAAAGLEVLIAGHEWYRQRVVFLDFLPPGFGADSDYLQRVLASKFRNGKYRSQGTFTVNLTYAEFLALALPFAIYFAVEAKKQAGRFSGMVISAMIIPGIVIADSRSGLIGAAIGVIGSVGLHAARRWRKDKASLLGPVLAIMFPIVTTAFVVAVMSSRTLGIMILGDGAQAASTAARGTQWAMGLPKIAVSPLFGYGVGQQGVTLGFVSPSGVLTIDTWVLSSLLESGIIGFACFCGMLFAAVGRGIWLYTEGRAPSSSLGGVIAVSLLAFAVIKTVLSQIDNHTLIYMFCAWVACLSAIESRYRRSTEAKGSA